MAWGMFLAIPCPFRRWDEAARGRMLGFLPLIGLIVGAIWAAAAHLCTALNLPSAVRALILCALPWLVTGFLHLDGFMDVCDAVLSRRDLETRQRILKDSHCGSFAVICMILLAAGITTILFKSIVDACGSARLHTRLFRDCGSNAETDANEPVQRSCSERGLRRFALCSARTLSCTSPAALRQSRFCADCGCCGILDLHSARKKAARRHERRYFRLFAYSCGACGHCGTASVWPHVNGSKQLNR